MLSSIGAEFEGSEAEFVCKNLNGKSLDEIVEEGSKRLQAFGGFVSAQGSSAQAAAAEEETAAAEVVEEEVEDAMEGGMDLFGGDDDW